MSFVELYGAEKRCMLLSYGAASYYFWQRKREFRIIKTLQFSFSTGWNILKHTSSATPWYHFCSMRPNFQVTGAGGQVWSGFPDDARCDSQDSRRIPMFHLKIGPLFTQFTTSCEQILVNWPKVRTNQFQGSDFGLKVGTRRNSFAPYRFWSRIFKT